MEECTEWMLNDCPHCEEQVAVTTWGDSEPIFCPMCGVDVSDEFVKEDG